MRISARGRYALAAAIKIAQQYHSDKCRCTISSATIAQSLGMSKIYLEQTLVVLKNSGLLVASKGQGGGYRLCAAPSAITAWDILCTIESSLAEKADSNVECPHIEEALDFAFYTLDIGIKAVLDEITLQQLLEISLREKSNEFWMLNM